jgi:hypothetical protein
VGGASAAARLRLGAAAGRRRAAGWRRRSAGARQLRRRAGGCGRCGGEWALASALLGAGSAAAARWSKGPEAEADGCGVSADAGSGRDSGVGAGAGERRPQQAHARVERSVGGGLCRTPAAGWRRHARGRRGTSAGVSGTRTVRAGAVRQERWPSRTMSCRRACADAGPAARLSASEAHVCGSVGELERGAHGAGTRRHTYAEVSARLSAMVQEWSSGLAVPRRGDSARTCTGKAMEPRVRDVGDR